MSTGAPAALICVVAGRGRFGGGRRATSTSRDGNFNVGLASAATDEWTQTYPVTAGREARHRQHQRPIDDRQPAADGQHVEVRAERIARASTDEAARGAAEARSKSRKTSCPIACHSRRERRRRRGHDGPASKSAIKCAGGDHLDGTTTNGAVSAHRAHRQGRRHTTNGGVKGDGLAAASTRASTNGGVDDRARVRSAGSRDARDGQRRRLAGSVPRPRKATDLRPTCTNGGISVDDASTVRGGREQIGRHLEGKLNGGGTAVELQTTNGGDRAFTRSRQRVTPGRAARDGPSPTHERGQVATLPPPDSAGLSIASLAWARLLLAGLLRDGRSGVASQRGGRALGGLLAARGRCSPVVVLLRSSTKPARLPLGFYSGYVLEHRYGLSRQTLRRLAGDHVKANSSSAARPRACCAASILYR